MRITVKKKEKKNYKSVKLVVFVLVFILLDKLRFAIVFMVYGQ